MSEQYKVIALYTDEGKEYFQIGRKIEVDKPLCSDNVEWKLDKNNKPMRLDSFDLAVESCYGKDFLKRWKKGTLKKNEGFN